MLAGLADTCSAWRCSGETRRRRHPHRRGARRPAVRGRRAAPRGAPTRSPGRRWFAEHGVSLRPPLHRLARLRPEPADAVHRPVPRRARRHPDRRARQDGRRLPHALAAPGRGADARQLVPRRRLRHPLRRQVAHLPCRPAPTRPPAGRWPPTTTTASSTTPRSQRYLDADPLDPFGFSGWVGPEPHGARAGQQRRCVRDPLIADRVVAWLEDRYARRRAGDADALRPFLLVASFVNPHDIVLFPAWARGSSPIEPSPLDPPPVPPRADRRRGPVAPSRPRRSPSAPRTRPATARRRPSPASTTRERAARTATSTTACTPRSTARSTGCAGRSPRAGRPTRCSCAPPTTASCSAPTAACTRSGSTSTTRRPGCRSSIARIGDRPTSPRDRRRACRRRTSTSCRRCCRRPASTQPTVAAELRRSVHRGAPAARAATCMPVVDGPAAADRRARRLPA